jgi:uncharacterized Rmd1/YagE family protein
VEQVFIFEFGCVVYWDMSEAQIEKTLAVVSEMLGLQGRRTYFGASQMVEASNDDMLFTIDSNEMKHQVEFSKWDPGKEGEFYDRAPCVNIKHDLIIMETDSMRLRLAISYAIAQSSVLSVFEWQTESLSLELRSIPEALQADGKFIHKRNDSVKVYQRKMQGRVFKLRSDINLQSDILDIPDYFGGTENEIRQEKYQPEYDRVGAYLHLTSRTKRLLLRLDMLSELLEVVCAQQVVEGTHYEVMIIIYLIIAYVAIFLCNFLSSGEIET